MAVDVLLARLSPPAPSVRVTVPPGLGLVPRALMSPAPVTVRPPASSVSVPEPTTSVPLPLRVTLRAPKSRSQVGPESVTVPSMVQVVAPQQPGSLRMAAALQVVLVHTASAAQLAPSTTASATARRRVSGTRPPPDSA